MPWVIVWLVGGVVLITGELGAVFDKHHGPSQTISSWVARVRKWTRGASIPVVLIGLAVLAFHFTFQR